MPRQPARELPYVRTLGPWARGDYVLVTHNAASTARLPIVLR